MDRNAHETLANGAKFCALADRFGAAAPYRAEEVNAACRNCLLYDEHTWGAYCSIDQPDSDFTKAQWKIKAQFAEDAAKQAAAILDRGTRALASLVRADGLSLVVHVWEDAKRIDFHNTFHKEKTYKKEAVYFTFPFAAQRPTFRYEESAAIINANKDMLPGACLDWFTVQHFVEIEGRDATIAWATPDAPMACFQDINRGKWLKEVLFNNGHIYAYVMNNYWFTN
jgi:hypothetical protein